MLVLAGAHQRAGTPERVLLEAAGEALLAGWKGTAFLAYYWLGAVVLFVLAWALRRSADFPPSAAWWAATCPR